MRAVVPPTVSTNASFAETLEEVTAGNVLLILLAIGAVGGVAYYLATRPKALASPAPGANTAVAATLRPTPPGNTFSPGGTVQIPPGVTVTVAPATQQTLAVMSGDSVTLTLPSGAAWKQVIVGKSDNSSFAPVALGADLQSPVSVALSTLTSLGYNAIAAQWVDGHGVTQASLYAVTVEQKPLTLHV